MTPEHKALVAELRRRAERRVQTEGPFTKENLVEWRAIAAIESLSAQCAQPANPAQVTEATEDRRQFKNFHRLLCDRFGYTHDEKDWFRDQVSLIEHIAAIGAGGRGRVRPRPSGAIYSVSGSTWIDYQGKNTGQIFAFCSRAIDSIFQANDLRRQQMGDRDDFCGNVRRRWWAGSRPGKGGL